MNWQFWGDVGDLVGTMRHVCLHYPNGAGELASDQSNHSRFFFGSELASIEYLINICWPRSRPFIEMTQNRQKSLAVAFDCDINDILRRFDLLI